MRQVFWRVQGNNFSLHAPVYLRISSDFYLKIAPIWDKRYFIILRRILLLEMFHVKHFLHFYMIRRAQTGKFGDFWRCFT